MKEAQHRRSCSAHGNEEVGQHIQREFERVGALVTRDLEGYPALQRKVLDEITRVEEDYKKCGEVPPPPPDWVEAVSGIAKIKSEHSEHGQEDTRGDQALGRQHPHQSARRVPPRVPVRHKILNGFMPFWRSLDKTLGQVDKKLTGLQDTSARIDAQMEKYEQINKKTDKRARVDGLRLHPVRHFSPCLADCDGGALINFKLIALPMSEMVGAGRLPDGRAAHFRGGARHHLRRSDDGLVPDGGLHQDASHRRIANMMTSESECACPPVR